MADVARLIRGTLRSRKIKARHRRGYADGGAAFGTMSPAEDAERPRTFIDNLVSDVGHSMATLPRRAIEASTQDVQHLGDPDYRRQSIGPALETAMTMTGGAGIVPAEANSLRAGIGAGFRSHAGEALGKFAEDKTGILDRFQRAVAEARKPIDPVRDARISGGYTQPAYRGMQLWDRGSATPVYKGAELYSTESPMLADMYASHLTKHPGWKPAEGSFGEGATVSPLYIDTSKYHHADAKGEVWSSFNYKAIAKAKEEGKPGVVIDNVWDEPGSTQALPGPKRIFITFPEGASTVKSKFATKFDKNSPNMMHGIGAIGIGGPASGYVSSLPMPGESKAAGGAVAMAEGGVPDLPDAPWAAAPVAPAPASAALPDAPWAAPEPASGTGYDVAASGAAGAGKGMAHFLGAAGDLRNFASRATDVAGQTLGIDPAKIQTIKDVASRVAPVTLAQGPTSEQVQHGIEGVTGKFHKPETTAGKYAGSIAETVANPASYLGPGGLGVKALMATASGAGSEAAGQAFEGRAGEGPARFAGAMLAGPLAARAIKPQLAPAQQMLADRGVTQMTPGQLTGGLLKDVEDKLTSFPILGHFIQNSRNRSVESFNRSVANQALEPIGERLATRTTAGHQAVAEVERKLSNAYDRVVPNLTFRPDYDFAHDLATIRQNASTMPASTVQDFDRILNDRLSPNRWLHQINLPPAAAPGSNTLGQQATHLWSLQGREFKSIESELSRLAGQYGSSSDAAHQMLGARIGDVVTAMRQNLERVNPRHADELRSINSGWAMYARMRTAAANRRGSEGVFTPGDLLTAVKRGDRSVQKGSFARGDALMQDFAEAGQRVLPSKVPDSGTAGRSLTSLLTAGGLGYLNPKVLAGVAAASLPYNRPAMAMLNRYVRPTQGARAAYANAGRGAVPAARALLTTPYGGQPSNPYATP